MRYKLRTGNTINVPVADYYAESDEELEEFENVVPGSTGLVLTETELKIKMYRSTGWVEV